MKPAKIKDSATAVLFCRGDVPDHPVGGVARGSNSCLWVETISALEKILDGMEIDLEPFALCELRGEGQLALDGQDNALLHYVLAGRGWINVKDQPKRLLERGSLAIVPSSLRHHLGADQERGEYLPTCRPVEPDWQLHQVGFGETGLLLVCGRLSASYLGIRSLFDILSAPIVTNLGGLPEARVALDQLLVELADPGPGSQALTRSLMLQCMILLLRQEKTGFREVLNWLGAVELTGFGPIVRDILNRPQSDYSLDGLAAAAGMSRSSFAEHFKAAMGRGPMDFVREVRLQEAARLLTVSRLPVKTIAGKIGYASRSHFSRSFQASYGMAPAQYRNEQQKKGATSQSPQ